MNKALIASVESIAISDSFETLDSGLEAIEDVKEIARDELEVAVNAGSLVSFVAGLSADEKDDVLYSTQFAQRAATDCAQATSGQTTTPGRRSPLLDSCLPNVFRLEPEFDRRKAGYHC